MLHFCSLYSGSTGNCLFIKTETTNILIDAGVSSKKIVTALNSLDCHIENINAILVTHEHIDHVRSLGTISKKYNIPVYANIETWNAIHNHKDKIEKHNQRTFINSKNFEIGNLSVSPFSIPHDAVNPSGFNIHHKNSKISVATDLGHINTEILSYLQDSSFIMLESNYDPDILKLSSYPGYLKSRITGPNGHLSNSTAGKTISSLINTGLKEVMLGHLSKENNFPELAYQTVIEELNSNNITEKDISINIAGRLGPSKFITI